MDALAKVLKLTLRYAWVVFIATCILLFAPNDAARQIGIYELRQMFGTFLFALMALTGAVSLRAVFHADRDTFAKWLKQGQDLWMRKGQERKAREALALRLRSLDHEEMMWIKYCLYHNTQTLTAECTNRIAQSLYRKGIVEEGSGHILDLPFYIPKHVWRYLLEHKAEFILEAEMNDEHFPTALDNFRKALRSA